MSKLLHFLYCGKKCVQLLSLECGEEALQDVLKAARLDFGVTFSLNQLIWTNGKKSGNFQFPETLMKWLDECESQAVYCYVAVNTCQPNAANYHQSHNPESPTNSFQRQFDQMPQTSYTTNQPSRPIQCFLGKKLDPPNSASVKVLNLPETAQRFVAPNEKPPLDRGTGLRSVNSYSHYVSSRPINSNTVPLTTIQQETRLTRQMATMHIQPKTQAQTSANNSFKLKFYPSEEGANIPHTPTNNLHENNLIPMPVRESRNSESRTILLPGQQILMDGGRIKCRSVEKKLVEPPSPANRLATLPPVYQDINEANASVAIKQPNTYQGQNPETPPTNKPVEYIPKTNPFERRQQHATYLQHAPQVQPIMEPRPMTVNQRQQPTQFRTGGQEPRRSIKLLNHPLQQVPQQQHTNYQNYGNSRR